MRRSDVLLAVAVAGVALAILAGTVFRLAGGGPEALTHCGCAASKGGCTEPCSTCCGPAGMADCWKNPNPSGR